MMLVAAKWRDFCELNPHTQPDGDLSTQSIDEERNNRSSRTQDLEDEEDED